MENNQVPSTDSLLISIPLASILDDNSSYFEDVGSSATLKTTGSGVLSQVGNDCRSALEDFSQDDISSSSSQLSQLSSSKHSSTSLEEYISQKLADTQFGDLDIEVAQKLQTILTICSESSQNQNENSILRQARNYNGQYDGSSKGIQPMINGKPTLQDFRQYTLFASWFTSCLRIDGDPFGNHLYNMSSIQGQIQETIGNINVSTSSPSQNVDQNSKKENSVSTSRSSLQIHSSREIKKILKQKSSKKSKKKDYLKREYACRKKKYKCSLCPQTFSKHQALGGHMSRSHSGQSLSYKYKLLRREERTPERSRLERAKQIYEESFGTKRILYRNNLNQIVARLKHKEEAVVELDCSESIFCQTMEEGSSLA